MRTVAPSSEAQRRRRCRERRELISSIVSGLLKTSSVQRLRDTPGCWRVGLKSLISSADERLEEKRRGSGPSLTCPSQTKCLGAIPEYDNESTSCWKEETAEKRVM